MHGVIAPPDREASITPFLPRGGLPPPLGSLPASPCVICDDLLPHIDALYRNALRMTRRGPDAEDLVQETYLRAFRFQRAFRPGTNPKAWLFTIMVNLFRNRVARRTIQETSLDAGVAEIRGDDGRSRHGLDLLPPDVFVEQRSFGRAVKQALDELPAYMRGVVILVDVEGFSYRETPQILAIRIGTVMSRLHRARQELRLRLAAYAPAEPAAGRVATTRASAPAPSRIAARLTRTPRTGIKPTTVSTNRPASKAQAA